MCFRPATVTPDVRCPSCGKEVAATLERCPECGAELPKMAMPGIPGAPGAPKPPGAPGAPGAPKPPAQD